MIDIRWLEISAGNREYFKHPSAIFIDRAQYSAYRVLQVRLHDAPDTWQDVPIIEYKQPDTADK